MPETRKYADRAEYLKEAVAKRRRTIKAKAIEEGGGCCQICGYDKCLRALSFHHRKRKTKKFGISAKGYSRSWKKVKAEIKKCILLCTNCHMEVEDGITPVPA